MFRERRHSSRRLLLELLEPRQMLAFSIGAEFTAGSGPGFIPPDTMGAVGPDHIVELINGRYAVYDKTGAPQTSSSLDQFWINAGVNPAGSFSFDPRVVYDAASARFFAAAVDNARGPNNFLVAVSSSSDPTAGWSGFQIDADSDDSHWADFPMLGLDNDVVTVSANMFGLAGQSTTATFLVIPKSDLLAGIPTVANRTLFENVPNDVTGASVQPVVDLTDGNLPLILMAENKEVGALKASSIGGTAAAPTLNTVGGIIIVTPRPEPPPINQPGPKANIDTSDTRFSGNVIRQQTPGRTDESIWAVHSVNVGGRAAIEWYEINAVTSAVFQSGVISDPSLAFNYPSISVNAYGDVVIGFSGGSPSTFMSTYVAVGHTNGGGTTFDPVMQTHAGVADYENLDSIGRNRWGDYSATVLDPTDQKRVWTFQEFVSATDQWSIRVTEIVLPTSVTGRHLFYENSSYDSGAGIDAADSDAIATDKSAYLPGAGTITSASMTSYSRGLNGVFVDLTGAHGTLSLTDFEFAMSDQGSGALNTNTPSTWTAAPAPTAFTVLSDTPAAGTDRVEFIWADNAIENRYLEVATRGDDAAGGNNTNTGLSATDLFYFGNIMGDTFNDAAPTVWLTTAADETAIQASPIISVATIDSLFDMDRNGTHLASDRIVTRGNTIFALNKLILTDPPAAPAPAAGDDDGAGSAVASALTISDASTLLDSSAPLPALPSRIDSGGRVTGGLLPLLEEPDGLPTLALSQAVDEVEDVLDFDENLLDHLVTRFLS